MTEPGTQSTESPSEGTTPAPGALGSFIRDLRRNARISLRQLADQAGVSNPYLSQIERGLRKPSAEVLAQLAGALRVSTPMMYLRAGLLEHRDHMDVLNAIAADPELTVAQKQSLIQIYETFRRENARDTPASTVDDTDGAGTPDRSADEEKAPPRAAPARRPAARKAAGSRAGQRKPTSDGAGTGDAGAGGTAD